MEQEIMEQKEHWPLEMGRYIDTSLYRDTLRP